MTSEPDSTPRRRPPTIDLTATEVDAEKPAAAPQPGTSEPAAADARPDSRPANGWARAEPPTIVHQIGGRRHCRWRRGRDRRHRNRRRALVRWLRAAASLLAGIADCAAAEQRGDCRDLGAARTKSKARLRPNKNPFRRHSPTRRWSPVWPPRKPQTKSLSDSLAALTRRIDDVAAAAQNALAQAKSASTAADAAKSAAQAGVTRSDLDALAARIAPLESTVKTLADAIKHETATADDRAARLAVAAEALRAAVERGAPYQAELAAVKSLGADQSATAPLEPFAAAGVPSAAALAHELASLTPALRQAAEPASSNNSFLGRLESNAQRLVRITPVDAPPGDDPASVVDADQRRCRRSRHRRGARRYRQIAGRGKAACRGVGRESARRATPPSRRAENLPPTRSRRSSKPSPQ